MKDLKDFFEGIEPCSDHYCVFRSNPSTGMGTNGGCRCVRNRPHLAQIVLQRLNKAVRKEHESTN